MTFLLRGVPKSYFFVIFNIFLNYIVGTKNVKLDRVFMINGFGTKQ